MQVSDPNNVKIYNLSAGRSLPEWLSDRKRRTLIKKNVDIRRRIELIQDFQMPGLSTSIRMSADGHYIMATGIYKPRVRCFDVDNLAMKFERCFDAEVVTFEMLSDDYTKVVFLQCDRYVEFHSAEGRYYRLRIPKFGHDMKYHKHTCDLYLAGASSDIYRLNLEKGQFLNSFVSTAPEINKLAINSDHGLIIVGSTEGKLEAWDPRTRNSVATLDCALSCIADNDTANIEGVPAVTALEFNGPLTLGAGLSTGQVLLYDLRSNKPFKVKDHLYGLPIKDIAFHEDYVLSMDSSIVKIWNKDTGSIFTSIESGNDCEFNNLCLIPNSGMMFIANENVKIRTYYIPSLGPAPKWCGFLDALTEELEENTKETVYDDYKFVTQKELDELGLSHLIGSNLLRAYMHGYFIDVRLYRKAKSVAEPFVFEEYRKKKVRDKIEADRVNRVQIEKLPTVNKELAKKLMDQKRSIEKNLLHDERFKQLFENPEFQVDTNAEEYKLLNPILKRVENTKGAMKKVILESFKPVEEEREGKPSSEESGTESEYSSDDDRSWSKELKQEYRAAKKRRIAQEREDYRNNHTQSSDEEEGNKFDAQEKAPKFYKLKTGQEFIGSLANTDVEIAPEASLAERVDQESKNAVEVLSYGNRVMSYVPSKNKRYRKEEIAMEKHHKERKRLMRPPPKHLKKTNFWSGPKRHR